MTDDSWVDAHLADHAPPAAAARCTLAPDAFDLGRIMAWRRADAPDPAVEAHLATCDFCRSLLPGLAVEQTDAMTRALADRVPRRRRWPVVAGVAMACAAALLAFVLRPTAALDFDAFTIDLPGPQYTEGRFTGALATVKSTSTGATFTPRSTLRWVLRPPSATDRAGSVTLYRVDAGERLVHVPANARLNPRTGAAIIQLQPIGDRLPHGRQRIVAVLAAGDAPDLNGLPAAYLDRIPGAATLIRKIEIVESSP